MQVPDKVKSKLKSLPAQPGVYLMRDRSGRVIYVGKAKSLRNRVRSYFQSNRRSRAEAKIRSLIHSIADFDIIALRTEEDAILTEGRLIKEYNPYYNTLFKDDKRFIMLRIQLADPFPRLTTARLRKPDGASYFGPYASSYAAHGTRRFVEEYYGLRRCKTREPDADDHKHCMLDIVSTCSAPCIGSVSPDEYKERCREAVAFLRGERPEVLKELREKMETAAAGMEFEKAGELRDVLFHLRKTVRQRATGKKDLAVQEEEAFVGMEELQRELNLPTLPRVIETFDISNISGTYAVASMVCAVDGRPARNRYRRFRMKYVEGPNDPAMMAEATHRRYSRLKDEGKEMPDLIVFDGGITQLRAGRKALDDLGLELVPAVGLAKRHEEIVWDLTNKEPGLRLGDDSPGLRILRSIRDEAHRFALTYHRTLRERRIRESMLDDIPGVGEKRKQVLLKHFGSVRRLQKASLEELQEVPGVGEQFAHVLYEAMHRNGS